MGSAGSNASPGDIIAGRYRIESWVGQGNMATVFHATHLGTGQSCALKLVHAHLVERPEIQELFVQEARVGGRIRKNPYIVDVFDAGIDGDRGVPFLAMDLLEGTTLDKYIKHHGQMPPGLLKTLWVQLADALEQAHSAGVVHRDLKPGNLFLTYDRKGKPQLRVVDFGIAKLMEEGIQRTATQIGTPAYAAPEQLGSGMRTVAGRMGYKISAAISPAADIWSLGIVTYEMLTGAPPGQFWTGRERGSIADLMVLVATEPTPSAVERADARRILLPPGFDGWLERCLQKNAADRWPSVELAVHHLLALFDQDNEARNKFGSTKEPAAVMNAPARRPNPEQPVWLPPQKSNGASVPDSIAFRDGSAEPQSSTAQADNLTASSPLAHRASQLDGTGYGIAETTTPKRAKHVQKMGVFIVGALSILAASILILSRASSLAENADSSRVQPSTAPTLPLAASTPTPPNVLFDQPSSLAPVVTPSESASPAAPLPSEPKPSPKLPGSVPKPPVPLASASTSVTPPNTATLNFNSIPPSRIVLDGRPMGQAPLLGVSVTAGTHTVLFVHPEKGRKSIAVTVGAGESKTAHVKFD